MENTKKYEQYLGDSNFVKYGIVVSSLVWDKSYSQISEIFSVTKPYISQVMKRWKSEDQFKDRRASNGGHNKKLTESKSKSMIGLIEEDRTKDLAQIVEDIEKEYLITCHSTTVGRTLKSLGFVKPLPVQAPHLSNNALTKRFAHAIRHLDDLFSNVCFSDESMFQLSENRQLCWWNPQEEDRPVFEHLHNKKKVMIWGGISRRGITDLYFWKVDKDNKVDAYAYTNCLSEVLVDRMDGMYGKGRWRLMQDNARPHSALHTQDFLAEHDIKTLDHPPYSPDLNPIELVWAYLKKKIMCRSYNNLDEVLERIFEEWYDIPLDMINNLIDGHITRVKQVYEAKGAFNI